MFFDWKIQLEKVQITRDIIDDTKIFQGIRLLCKKDIAILLHEHKQPLYGFPKKPAQFFK